MPNKEGLEKALKLCLENLAKCSDDIRPFDHISCSYDECCWRRECESLNLFAEDEEKELITDEDREFNAILIDRLYLLADQGAYTGEFWTIWNLLHLRAGKGLIDFDMTLHLVTLHENYGVKSLQKSKEKNNNG